MKISPVTIEEICLLVGGEVDPKNHQYEINDISSLKDGISGSISFFMGNFAYLHDLQQTKASVCLVSQKYLHRIPQNVIPVLVNDPYTAIAKIITKHIGDGELYPTQFLDDTRKCGGISKFATISSCAKIGKDVIIMPNVYVGSNVIIGDGVVLHNNASVEHCEIGNHSIIRAGARIGTSGFGFAPNFQNGKHTIIPQISKVIIGQNVDIGANTTIDRGFLSPTHIGDYTKIDNLVQIAHGVKIGNSCFLAGGTSIAGSATIGNCVMIGGHSAIAGHITIPDFTQITAMSGVAKGPSVKGTTISGIPAMESTLWKKIQTKMKRLIID